MYSSGTDLIFLTWYLIIHSYDIIVDMVEMMLEKAISIVAAV